MPQSAQHEEFRQSRRESFSNARVSMGAGHWLRTAGILAPLVIGEIVKDPDKRWRLIRLSAVVIAGISEVTWANRIRRERDHYREEREYGGR
jgi:hypothetical protein